MNPLPSTTVRRHRAPTGCWHHAPQAVAAPGLAATTFASPMAIAMAKPDALGVSTATHRPPEPSP